MQRRLEKQSAAAGGRLADIEIPRGLIVAAILRGGKCIIPRGDLRLEAGDDVIVFALKSEASLVHLLFPGGDGE
jgi:trk system potassium uptake protein TrkA